MTEAKQELKIGDRVSDGTVIAGRSGYTGNIMYVTPEDAPLTYKFYEAQKYAGKFEAYGHDDWRLATRRELKEIFENRAAIGGFNENSSYWTSSEDDYNGATVQDFSDGSQGYDFKSNNNSLRLVRG